jgi:ABC transport system ATP-binding/permease protein
MHTNKPTGNSEIEGSFVEVLQVNKWVRRKLNILHDISLVVKPNEFIMVVGQSGGGKTTLVDAIAGYRPATNGRVFVDGIDVYHNTASMRGKIGYVPQRDIIHMELTVYQALDYSARLRLPPRTSKEERHQRILEVMEELSLNKQRDVRISDLSGGQQKRVSIGVELLTRPRLFFLDEPTSGLDPGNETAFMHLMRRVADQGRTVIMITHTTKNIMLADEVLFMDSGGYMAWYGPPKEALAYFDPYRHQSHLDDDTMEFDDIYAVLENTELGGPKDWADRFLASQAYRTYIAEPLQLRQQQLEDLKVQPKLKEKSGSFSSSKITALKKAGKNQLRVDKKWARENTISPFRQFVILSSRNLTILLRDRSSLILMLLIAPLVGSVDFIVAPILGKDTFNYVTGNAIYANVALFMLTLYALMVGGMSQMREFVKEGSIYRRERLVNLRIFPYVASKVWVALLLAFYHALAFTVLHYAAFKVPGGFLEFVENYITLVLSVMTGMMLGLMASAISNNPGITPLVMISLMVPMLVFSGGLAPSPDYLSAWATTRWSLQGLSGISGMGSDVSRDTCWDLPKAVRDAMTLEDKAFYQCPCMGVKMFDQSSCDFPGLGALKNAQISEQPPIPPSALPESPAEPTLPEAPAPPQDTANQVQVVEYLDTLKQYEKEVSGIQENYRNQINLYQNTVTIYQVHLVQYQEDLAQYTIARAAAVSAGEALIDGVAVQADWSWVDKRDPNIYFPWLFKTWIAQLILVALYFFIILILVKSKDVH